MIDSPVFLIDIDDAGATILRGMLSHHPLIAVDDMAPTMAEERDPKTRFTARAASAGQRNHLGRVGLQQREESEIAKITEALEQSPRNGAALLCVNAQIDFAAVLDLWPRARFIHFVRDGRDVAFSAVNAGQAGNLFSGIHDWVEAESWWATLAAQLATDRHITVQYEALIDQPEREMTRLCSFLGVPFDRRVLEHARASHRVAPFTGDVTRWRFVNAADLAATEAFAGRWLEANGYSCSQPPSRIRRRLRLYYAVENYWMRIRLLLRGLVSMPIIETPRLA